MSSTKKLGSWFPSATVSKAGTVDQCSLLLFYHYCQPQLSKHRKDALTTFLQTTTSELKLGGRLRVAAEGMNCTISGTSETVRAFAAALSSWEDNTTTTSSSTSSSSAAAAASTTTRGPFASPPPDYKYIDSLPPDRAFKDLKILPVNELVFYGIADSKQAPLTAGGVHLNPKEYHEKMNDKDTVVIDVRNHYEAEIGRFEGQELKGGAKYIDPMMRKSTDFIEWLGKPETKETLKGKEILMYCTGGVRCERASALLKTEYGDSVGGVYQLQGGVEKYLQEFPDGGHWKGKNFTFDKREAFGVGNLAGVGGVVEGGKAAKKRLANSTEEILGTCCVCAKKWDRFIGKKKCYTCGVPVLMCTGCCTDKPNKTAGKELSVRCGICKVEGVTVPVKDVSFTDNGIGVSYDGEGGSGVGGGGKGQAAKSVLKWGGGHAKEKQKKRELERNGSGNNGNATKGCKFGSECSRADCFFSHPTGWKVGRGSGDSGAGAGAGGGKRTKF